MLSSAALVLEDDVRLSPDVLEFFDLAASLAAASLASGGGQLRGGGWPTPSTATVGAGASEKPPVALASAFCYPRDTHADYAASRFLPGRLLAGGAAHYRHSPLASLTFRTLAWMVTREVYSAMRADFADGASPMLSLPDGAPLHASMQGCAYCENLCYDHWLEWRWRDRGVVCPSRPRASSSFSGGMTEHVGILHAKGDDGYHARQRAGVGLLNADADSVRSSRFVDDVDRRAAARHLRRVGLLATAVALLLLARGAWALGRTRLLLLPHHLRRRRGKVDAGRES